MFGFVLLMRGSLCGILLLQPAAGEIVIAEFRALLDDVIQKWKEKQMSETREMGKKK